MQCTGAAKPGVFKWTIIMNSNALVVTANLRDFRLAQESLGVQVISPLEFVLELGQFGW